jgi:hypothetical protein
LLARAGTGRKKHHTPPPDGGQHAVRHTGLRHVKKLRIDIRKGTI